MKSKNNKEKYKILAYIEKIESEKDFQSSGRKSGECYDVINKLKSHSSPQPSEEALNECLINAGREMERVSEKKVSKYFNFFFSPAKAAAAVLTIGLLSWGTVNLSSDALPGDILYPAKVFSEKTRLALTRSAEGEIELRISVSKERMNELLRYFDKKERVNLRLIERMLSDAHLALEKSYPLDVEKRYFYKERIEAMLNYQKKNLENLRPIADAGSREIIDRGIASCDEMMSGMHGRGGMMDRSGGMKMNRHRGP